MIFCSTHGGRRRGRKNNREDLRRLFLDGSLVCWSGGKRGEKSKIGPSEERREGGLQVWPVEEKEKKKKRI